MQDRGRYVLGLDGGTEAMRAAVFDTAGRQVAFARAPYRTVHARPGWAEQDPQDWWAAAVAATREAVSLSRVDVADIRGIAVACTSCTVVTTDAAGEPLRPALIWMDVRASQEAGRIAQTGDPALKYSGYTKISAEWLLSKVLWLADHEPGTYERAAHILEFTDWLGYRLTGEWAVSINTASIRGYYDRAAGGWPATLFSAVGLPDLVEKLPARVVDMGGPLGTLTSQAADELGLLPGTPVAEGGADAFVGMVGLNVISPGRAALITGSSHLHLAQTETPSYAPGMFGAYTDAVVPGHYTIEGGQVSTGSVISWFRNLCSGEHFSTGAIPPDRVFRVLQEQAKRIPPGCDGVLALDFWQGNRTPYVDADARGMIWGLSLGHTPAHIYRALIEAVCFGTENIFRTFASCGHQIDDVVACGGAIKSDLWMQIHADVSNLPITITAVPEAVSLGAGILASVAGDIYPDVATAARAMVHVEREIHPDAVNHAAYQFYFDRYVASFDAMRQLMHEVVEHVRL
ncbi:MAG: xylulose kinase [Sporichthyaceae bacterium]|nr:xylulose kinase [Sporichthyaceae bacterium]